MGAWVALHCKANSEAMVYQKLVEQGVETYFPRYEIVQRDNHRRRSRPLFPGYLFVQVDLEQVQPHLLYHLPGLIGVVAFGGKPAAIPAEAIEQVRQRLDQVTTVGGPSLLGLQKGDSVRILQGPFKDLEAVFDGALDGRGRVRVLLDVLGRLSRVELPAHEVQKVAPTQRERRSRGRGRPLLAH